LLKLKLFCFCLFILSFDLTCQISTTNLRLWLKSDSGVIETSGKVSEWKDCSGNNFDAVQSTVSQQPSLIPNQLGGYPIISFDQSLSNRLKIDSLINLDKFSVFILYKVIGNGYYAGPLSFTTSATKGFKMTSSISNAYTPNIVLTDNSSEVGFNRKATTTYGTSMSTYVIHNFQGNNDPGNYQINYKINGVVDPELSGPAGFSSAIGQYIGYGFRHISADIAEIIIYDTLLSNSQTQLIENYLREKYTPPVDLGLLYQLACDTSITLTLPDYFPQILWSTGETTQSITVSEVDTLTVQVTDIFGFQSSDTVILQAFRPPFIINTISDSLSCGFSVPWSTGLDTSNYSHIWPNSNTDSLLTITASGQYWLTVTDTFGCSKISDTITVMIDSLSIQTSLGTDKTVCKGSNIGLTIENSLDLTYLWSTGDTIPQTVIDSAGVYTIEVTNSNNCVGRDTIIIDTNGIAPNVNFTTQNLCSNAPAQFTNTSSTSDGSNIISEKWFFGDGDSTITPNPSHLYPTSISYAVTLEIITDSGCVNTFDSIIQIHNPPTSGFFVTSNPICSESTTSFTDNSFSTDGTINSWLWNFGDTGLIDTSNLQHPNYTFPTTNIYNIELITTTNHGCSDTTITPITVKQSPIVSFTSSDLCLNANTQFNNTSQGNIFALNWSFGNFNTSILNNPTNIYTASGNYLVSLSATEVNGCSDTLETTITIYENPLAKFDVQEFCAESTNQLFDSSTTNAGIITDWNWNVVNHANQSTNQNPVFSFTTIDTGFYYLDLNITTDLGCTDSIRDSINVFALPIPDFTFTPTTGAPPLTVNFTNLTIGASQHLWLFGDDSSSTLTSPTYIYQDSSNYTINLKTTSLYGCIDSVNKSIYVIDPITDIAINNLSYTFSTNSEYLNLTVELSNLGTFAINTVDLEIEISAFGKTLEKWTGSLNTGSSLSYPFSNSYEVNGEIPDLICVRAINPNGVTDGYPKNNEFCITTNKFQLISISPNPTSAYINLNYIIPTSGEATVNLYNSSGEKLKELFSGNLEKGLIRQNFNLETYSNGIYILEINFQENFIKEKILLK
jgi:PKD repeat protein